MVFHNITVLRARVLLSTFYGCVQIGVQMAMTESALDYVMLTQATGRIHGGAGNLLLLSTRHGTCLTAKAATEKRQ